MLAWPARAEVAAVRAVLDLVGMADSLHARAGALFGGQQQCTSVARALYNGRPVIIGDEPVSALDPVQAAGVLGLLRARHQTLILAMHDVPMALAHSDRIIVLGAGRVVLDAPSRDLAAETLMRFYALHDAAAVAAGLCRRQLRHRGRRAAVPSRGRRPRIGAATDLAVNAAIAGTGIVYLFEDWLRPHLDSGALEPVLEPWWQRFPGPFLYYPGKRLLPAPLRAFVSFIKASADQP